ncbi:MAG: nitronate monooxygenase [Candidatus Paceibacterota bacterium]|jgi:enoyl-[acyl-carrier protein] reductase II|nr:nitronate monooxygenase [bacterium]
MFENNRLVKLLNIKYPIIQGGMAGVSESVLVAAVSNAGGLGVIGSGFASPEWLLDEIQKTKKLTDKPFGVNLLMQNPNVADLVKIIIKEKIGVVFTGGGNPLAVAPYLKQAKIKIIPVVPTVRLAKKMEQSQMDAVVVEGLESGGHIGENTTFCLVPQASNIIKDIPVIAAGGIYDDRTFAAALIVGAEGVQIGTRFMATEECQIHNNYKNAIVNATDEDVVVIGRFTGHPIRAIKNRLTENIKKMEEKNPFPEEINSERFAGNKGMENIDLMPILSGIDAGGIVEIKTCKEVIEEIVFGAEKILNSGKKLLN